MTSLNQIFRKTLAWASITLVSTGTLVAAGLMGMSHTNEDAAKTYGIIAAFAAATAAVGGRATTRHYRQLKNTMIDDGPL